MMNPADFAVAFGVGVAITGIGGAVIRLGITIASKHAERHHDSRRERFFDWLEHIILGPLGRRIDHEPMYSCTIAAMALVSLGWMILAPLPPGVVVMSPATQTTLATCLAMGSYTCLYGITMGGPFDWLRWVRYWLRRWRGREPEPQLDIRRAYRVAASGLPATFLGFTYFVANLFGKSPIQSAAGRGAFLAFVCLGLWFQWARFLMEIRRINKTLPMLIEQELLRRELEEELGTVADENPDTGLD
jgi:hypothetical protein